VQEGNLACAIFPPWWNDVVQDVLLLVQEGKVACATFPAWWNDVVIRDVIGLGGKLAHASFPPH
jgi:hypothetical protein